MRAIWLSFMQMLLFVRRDMMLFIACLAPIFAGVFFKFAIPAIETMLVGWTGFEVILAPYYGLCDLFFSLLTPTMFCFTAAMVVLEEHDDHIEQYLFITVLGRKGYLISRMGVPAVIAFIVTLTLLPLFKLTTLSVLEIVFLSIMGAWQGVIIALLIVTLSTNKLEGMAVTKLSTLTILGVFAPYFVHSPMQYTFSFLPSFWCGKIMVSHHAVHMLLAVLLVFMWTFLLIKKYLKK